MPKPKSAIQKIAFGVIGIVLFGGAASFGVRSAFSWQQSKRQQMRATDLPITIRQAQPIIRAIGQYRKEHHALPQSLSALVPKYLRQLPNAGPAARDGWRYQPGTKQSAGEWALSIRVRDEYSPNLAGFGDTFAFHPSGRYPRVAYGGGLVPFGKWGYYIE
jgi:hypothetical protein